MTKEQLEKGWNIYSELNYLKNPEQFGRNGQINPESISKITEIELVANDMRLVFVRDDDEFLQLKKYFMGDAARRINRIAELEKELAEL